jgi:hypothetical protein
MIEDRMTISKLMQQMYLSMTMPGTTVPSQAPVAHCGIGILEATHTKWGARWK